jgi:NAD(P)-dependent dehydrogenase (short-subunit alcohol dehydrogenase family)
MRDMSFTADDVPDQRGRRVVVTGANSGIGFEAAKVLAQRGAEVVVACRNRTRGEDAAAKIRDAGADGTPTVEDLDLASLDSVAAFADRVGDEEIDVLVNNAGVMAIPRRETEDGFETQFGVNHLGHFALTGRLLDAVTDRVVTVSSGLHERGEMDFADIQSEEEYDRWDAYAQSKLANLLFAFELDRRLRTAGSDLRSVGVHPGYADTNLQLRGPQADGSTVRLAMMKVANTVLAQSAAAGALPTLYAATTPDVEGGAYYGPGGLFDMRGPPERQDPAPQATDREAARRLWNLSESLTGVEFGLPVAEDLTA